MDQPELGMSLEDLKTRLENDELIQSRIVDITLEDGKLTVKEHGNPDVYVDESGEKPTMEGEGEVPKRVQDLADEVLGRENYRSPTVYEDDTTSETIIRR